MKSLSGERLARAQQRRATARAQLRLTAETIQQRLSPARLARKAGEQIVETSEDVAAAGLLAARRNSKRIAGLAAVLTLVLLRRRIVRWVRGRRHRNETAPAEPS
jgi:hypothetical protein